MKRKIFVLAVGLSIFAMCVSVVNGQDLTAFESAPIAESARVLELSSNSADALVFVDSVLVGRAGDGRFLISGDARRVHLTAPTLGNWSITPIAADLPPRRGDVYAIDTVSVDLRFTYTYSINSSPYGARVSVALKNGEELRGRTPFSFSTKDPLQSEIVLSLEGYHEYALIPSTKLWNRHVATLEHTDGTISPSLVKTGRKRRRWIDAVSLGVAGGAAAVAIHYKTRADRRYEVYTSTGDPTLRPAIKRLDVRSGIALGVMQAGLGVFAIRMIID